MNKERKEALLRIPIGIIAWIIVELWGLLAVVLVVFNFFYTLIVGKRNKDVSKFVNHYVLYLYQTVRYIGFTTNKRPFPFEALGTPVEECEFNDEKTPKKRGRPKKNK